MMRTPRKIDSNQRRYSNITTLLTPGRAAPGTRTSVSNLDGELGESRSLTSDSLPNAYQKPGKTKDPLGDYGRL